MRETSDQQQCERSEEFISWLYHENDNPQQANDLERHLMTCGICRKDADEFQNIRRSIVAWRQSSLGSFASNREARRRSARAALQEFFNLSPLWMKGALACASVLLCILAASAIMRLRETPHESVAANTPTTEDLQKRVEQRAQEPAAEMHSRDLQRTDVVKMPVNKNPDVKRRVRATSFGSTEVAALLKKRRPLSAEERQELAADLRLNANGDDGEPDLLGDTNRRQR